MAKDEIQEVCELLLTKTPSLQQHCPQHLFTHTRHLARLNSARHRFSGWVPIPGIAPLGTFPVSLILKIPFLLPILSAYLLWFTLLLLFESFLLPPVSFQLWEYTTWIRITPFEPLSWTLSFVLFFVVVVEQNSPISFDKPERI